MTTSSPDANDTTVILPWGFGEALADVGPYKKIHHDGAAVRVDINGHKKAFIGQWDSTGVMRAVDGFVAGSRRTWGAVFVGFGDCAITYLTAMRRRGRRPRIHRN